VKHFSLSKRKILKDSREFDDVFQKGEKISSQHILLLYKVAEETRYGFSVARKIKGAVKRNRAKRRLRELLRLNQNKIPAELNLVLLAKPGIETCKFDKLNGEWIQLLEQLNKKLVK
jgi:ribonuclease P protein component